MQTPTGIISALAVGCAIGLLGRVVVPASRRAQIGWLMTVLIGLLGAALGLVVAASIDTGWLATLLLQITVAAVLVFLVSLSALGGDNRY